MKLVHIGISLSLFLLSCSTDNENGKRTSSFEKKSGNEGSNHCNFEDGTYSATVDYNNCKTSYSHIYTLDVEVQDCQVVQINFPNSGYIDEDHILFGDIDKNGSAFVNGENGKTYKIQINN